VDAVSLLQVGTALLLNLGFAWLVGSWFARYWLRWNGHSRSEFEPALRELDLWAAGLTALSIAIGLLVATASMGGVGLREACPMFWMMLTSTDYGHAGCITLMAMLILLAIRWLAGAAPATDIGVALSLVLVAGTRAAMGHAGEEGWLSIALAAEVVHFSAIGLWTGAVLVSAWFTLDERRIGCTAVGAYDRYLKLMSQASFAAVIAIFITGLYNAWHRVGAVEHLQHTMYGITLLIKVALVLLAVGLGGYNKFVGLPSASRSDGGLRVVRTALRIESYVLASVLLAASILISQQPPATV